MKKILLLILTLLVLPGAIKTYAQDPTVRFELLESRFCEKGNVTIKFYFTGSGNYDLTLRRGVQGTDFKFTGVQEAEETLENVTSTSVFEITSFKDYTQNIDGKILTGPTTAYIDQKPTPVINDPIKTCADDVTLSVTPENSDNPIEWRLDNPSDGVWDRTDTITPTLTVNRGDGTYKVWVKETQGACDEEEFSQDIDVVTKALPEGNINTDPIAICDEETAELLFENLSCAVWPITVHLSDGTNDFSETFSETDDHKYITNTLQYINSPYNYTLTSLVDAQGCITPKAESTEVSVDFIPTANAGEDIIECGNSVELQAILPIECTGEWKYSSPEFFSDINDANATFEIDYNIQEATDTHTLTWEVTNTNNTQCKDDDMVDVELHKQPESNIITESDNNLYIIEEISLEAEEDDELTGQWSIVESADINMIIEDYNSAITRAIHSTEGTKLSGGRYVFGWTVSNTLSSLCTDITSTVEFLSNQMLATTGFSPNGDNINDNFIIGGASNIKNNRLIIFDVNGKEIFKADDFMISDSTIDGWNAITSNGEEAKDGTYYYIFTGDGIDPIKNFLIIKRSK